MSKMAWFRKQHLNNALLDAQNCEGLGVFWGMGCQEPGGKRPGFRVWLPQTAWSLPGSAHTRPASSWGLRGLPGLLGG